MKNRIQLFQTLVLVAAALSSTASFAQNASGAATVRPAGYKPKAGDTAAASDTKRDLDAIKEWLKE